MSEENNKLVGLSQENISKCRKKITEGKKTVVEGLKGLNVYLPEFISLWANIADIFLESALRLYIVQAACQSLHPYSSVCNDVRGEAKASEGVQALAAFYLMCNRLILEIPSLFILPFCGSWTDQIGQKVPIMLTGVGCALSALVFLISTAHPGKYLWMILVGTSIRSLVCRTAVITMAVSTMVADTTTKEERTRRLSFLLSTRYFGIIIGLVCQSLLLAKNQFSYVFLLDIILFGLIMVLAMILIKNKSSIQEADDSKKEKSTDCHFWESVKILFKTPGRGTLLQLWIMLIILMLDHAAKAGEKEVLILFVNIRIPGFSNSHFSWYFTVETIVLAVVSTFGIQIALKVLKLNELQVSIFGILSRIGKHIFLAFTDNVPLLRPGNGERSLILLILEH